MVLVFLPLVRLAPPFVVRSASDRHFFAASFLKLTSVRSEDDCFPFPFWFLFFLDLSGSRSVRRRFCFCDMGFLRDNKRGWKACNLHVSMVMCSEEHEMDACSCGAVPNHQFANAVRIES